MRHSLLFALPFVGASISIILIWHSATIKQIKVELILPIPQLGGDGLSRVLRRHSRQFDLSILVDEDVHAELPRGGVLYRLGGLAKSSTKNMSSTQARRAIEVRLSPSTNSSAVRFDMLFSDYSGAFDRDVPRRQGIQSFYVPWEDSQAWPLFLVLYNCGSSAEVRYVEMTLSDMGAFAQEDAVVNIQEERKYPRRDLYFRRRTGSSGKVTLCTQLTPERLHHLEHIVKHWGGPVSAVIYVGHRESSQNDEITQISNFWDSAADTISSFLDVHIVYDDKRPWFSTSAGGQQNPYPINLLRQIALDAAQTEWVLLLEADMVTVPNAQDVVERSWGQMMEIYNREPSGAAFVVPFYIFRVHLDDEGAIERFPNNKKALKENLASVEDNYSVERTAMGKRGIDVAKGSLKQKAREISQARSGKFFRAGDMYTNHRLVDYDAWESLPDDGANFMKMHSFGDREGLCDPPSRMSEQEPYVLVNKGGLPPYHVLFSGMQWDKVVSITDLCNCGLSFFLHPSLFAMMFNEPRTSIGQGQWASESLPNWRQLFVFALMPIYAQEVQKARLQHMAVSQSEIAGGVKATCSRLAAIKEGEPMHYPPWAPQWVANDRGGTLRLLKTSYGSPPEINLTAMMQG